MSNKHPKMPIDTFLSTQTPYSRREILDLIKQNKVSVNGHRITNLNHEIHFKIDIVKVDDKRVDYTTRLVYYKFNKPRNVISTFDDPKGRVDLERFIQGLPDSVFPVGRLDRQSKGLLLFTNDGPLTHQILHPSYKLPKVYDVVLDKPITTAHLKRLTRSFFLDDGPVQLDNIEKFGDVELRVTISEGRNRIIRRSFEFFGYTVIKLERLSIGPVSLGNLKEGKVRELSIREIKDLKRALESGDSSKE